MFLKVFLNFFLKIKCCIDYQQLKSVCDNNILIKYIDLARAKSEAPINKFII